MDKRMEFRTRPEVRELEASFDRREPNVDFVRLNPGALAEAIPMDAPFALVWFVQGSVASARPLFYN